MTLEFSDAGRFLKFDLDVEKSSGAYYGLMSGQFDNFGFNKFIRIGKLELTSFLSSFCTVYENLEGKCYLFDDDLYRYFCLELTATKSGGFNVKISYTTDDTRDMFRAEMEIEQSYLNGIYLLAKNLLNY